MSPVTMFLNEDGNCVCAHVRTNAYFNYSFMLNILSLSWKQSQILLKWPFEYANDHAHGPKDIN